VGVETSGTLKGGEHPKLMTQSLNRKEHIKLTNQSLVFEVFADDEKLTIREVTHRVNEKLDRTEKLSEQTIRRAITNLCQLGQLKPFGKTQNAQTYGKLSASFTGSPKDELIPFGGNLVGVEEFLRLISDPNSRPLKRNVNLLAERSQHGIRRMMLFAILSAGEPGNDETLKSANTHLNDAIDELEYALDFLRRFVHSPIWFQQYRDKIALAVRELTKNDPELYKLAVDYMRAE
jgi:hypothetical protein